MVYSCILHFTLISFGTFSKNIATKKLVSSKSTSDQGRPKPEVLHSSVVAKELPPVKVDKTATKTPSFGCNLTITPVAATNENAASKPLPSVQNRVRLRIFRTFNFSSFYCCV